MEYLEQFLYFIQGLWIVFTENSLFSLYGYYLSFLMSGLGLILKYLGYIACAALVVLVLIFHEWVFYLLTFQWLSEFWKGLKALCKFLFVDCMIYVPKIVIGATVGIIPVTVGLTFKSYYSYYEGKHRSYVPEAWWQTHKKIWAIPFLGWRIKSLISVVPFVLMLASLPFVIVIAALTGMYYGAVIALFDKDAFKKLKIFTEPWNDVVKDYDGWMSRVVFETYEKHEFKEWDEKYPKFDLYLIDLVHAILGVAIAYFVGMFGFVLAALVYGLFIILRVAKTWLIKYPSKWFTDEKTPLLLVCMYLPFAAIAVGIVAATVVFLSTLVPIGAIVFAFTIGLGAGYTRGFWRSAVVTTEVVIWWMHFLRYQAQLTKNKRKYPISEERVELAFYHVALRYTKRQWFGKTRKQDIKELKETIAKLEKKIREEQQAAIKK